MQGSRVLVGRAEELGLLARFERRAERSNAGVFCIEGTTGYGKTALLETFAEQEQSQARTVLAHCRSRTDAYTPLVALASDLRGSVRLPGMARGALPDLASSLPYVGASIRSLFNSADAWKKDLVDVWGAAGTIDALVSLFTRAARSRPLILLVDDAHLIDPSSCSAIERLVLHAPSAHLGLVLGYQPEVPNAALEELLHELGRKERVERVRLDALSEENVAELLRVSRHSRRDQRATRELYQLTGGIPQMLKLAMGGETGASAKHPVGKPPRLLEENSEQTDAIIAELGPEAVSILRNGLVFRKRMEAVYPKHADLLSAAAVQGDAVSWATAVAVAGSKPREAKSALDELVATGVLHHVENAGDVTSDDDPLFNFEHTLLRMFIYYDHWTHDLLILHRKTAEQFAARLDADPNGYRRLLIPIVRQAHLGHDYPLAAVWSLRKARELAGRGSTAREVIESCELGLVNVRKARATADLNRTHAELVELLLEASELTWRGFDDELRRGRELELLAEEAVEAAAELNDKALGARMLMLKGKVRLHTKGLKPALTLLEDAYELSLSSDDVVCQYRTLVEYARQVPKVDVRRGVALLEEAERRYETQPELRDSENALLVRTSGLNAVQLGVNLMDAGRLGESVPRLRRAVADVRSKGALSLLPIGMNYLGQALISVGAFSEAIDVLHEAVELLSPDTGSEGWHANNLAQLGNLLVVFRRDVGGGLAMLDAAWQETDATRLANLMTLVRNLRAEALLSLPQEGPWDNAEEHLRAGVAEASAFGMLRSEIKSLSLLGRLYAQRDQQAQGLDFSRQAIARLSEVNWQMPALRTEDILLQHALLLIRGEDLASARQAVMHAYGEIMLKGESLAGEDRSRFLNEVPTNTRVVELVKNWPPPS